jgi:hypothetical protein
VPSNVDPAKNAQATVTLSEAKGLARPEREMLRYAQHDKLPPVLSEESGCVLIRLEYHLLLARDLNYLDAAAYDRLNRDTIEVKKMLAAFIKSLRAG